MNSVDGLDPELAEKQAFDIVTEFMESIDNGNTSFDKIDELMPLAFNENEEISRRMIEPVFGVLINNLKKSFKKSDGDLFLKIFPKFILEAKKSSEIVEKWFERMNISKINSQEDLYKRSIKLRNQQKSISPQERDNIKKVIVLSRNTIGAEAYINGIIISRLLENLKNAQIIFLDTANVGKHIFNHPRINSITSFINSDGKEVSLVWDRHNIKVLERFEYTANLSEFIDLETRKLKKEEFMVFDADTRLSQTGAMPICDEANHYFIDSATEGSKFGNVENFGSLCNNYLNKIFQEKKLNHPKIYLPENEKNIAKDFRNNLPRDKKIIMIHLGSGLKNKTLSAEFEQHLVLNSFKFGVPLIIKSPVEWEIEKIQNLIGFLERNGKKEGKDFFTFKGPLSTFVALISEMDLCIGYDSQSQHMAASLGIPFITLFTGHINRAFLKRWTPISKNFSRIIEVDKELVNHEEDALRKTIHHMEEFFQKA